MKDLREELRMRFNELCNIDFTEDRGYFDNLSESATYELINLINEILNKQK